MKRIKTFLYIFIIIPVLIGAVSCSDDIFHRISVELPMIKPRIKGSPTNFVIFNGGIYVATGRNIYFYSETDKKWTRKSFGESITQLAVTDSRIYALCYIDKDDSVVRKIMWSDAAKIDIGEWEEIPGFDSTDISDEEIAKYTIIHSIYSTDNKLYICAQFDYKKYSKETDDFNKYAVRVFYFDDSDSDPSNHSYKFAPVFSGESSAILYGAVFDGAVTYICTSNGIFAYAFQVNSADENPVKAERIESDVSNFIGIIRLPDNSIAAINRGGTLYKVETTGTTSIASLPNDRWASGAIALWKDIDTPENQLLLIGRQDREYTTTTGYTYGYMELELDAAGGIGETAAFKEPGTGQITSVHDNQRYASSLGIIPVNHIYQSLTSGIIYASTHQSGVWSYKKRSKDEYMWNSEE